MPPQALWFDWFETLVTVFDPSPAAQWWPAPTVPLQSLFSLVRSAGRRDDGSTNASASSGRECLSLQRIARLGSLRVDLWYHRTSKALACLCPAMACRGGALWKVSSRC